MEVIIRDKLILKVLQKLLLYMGLKFTIGAGTDQDFTRIPGRGLIKNEIDEETLQFISKKTGGKFFRATDIKALEEIYNEIDNLERSEIEVKEYTSYSEMYIWFLLPSLILGLLTEFFKRNIFRGPW